jgi:hypothetical protein
MDNSKSYIDVSGYTPIPESLLYVSKTRTPPPLTRDPRRKKKKRRTMSPISSLNKSRTPLEPIVELPDLVYLKNNIQSRSRQEVSDFWKVASMGAIMGGIGGLFIGLFFILVSNLRIFNHLSLISNFGISNFPISFFSSSRTCSEQTCKIFNNKFMRGDPMGKIGIEAYLDLFCGRQDKKLTGKTTLKSHRKLIQRVATPKLVIAGKMSVEDVSCNIAQLSLDSNEWSLKARIQLSLYNSYSGGEVYSLLANHTSDPSLQNFASDKGK